MANAKLEVAWVSMAMPTVKRTMASRSIQDPIRRLGRRPNLSRKLVRAAVLVEDLPVSVASEGGWVEFAYKIGGIVAIQKAIWIKPATKLLVSRDKPTFFSRTTVTESIKD